MDKSICLVISTYMRLHRRKINSKYLGTYLGLAARYRVEVPRYSVPKTHGAVEHCGCTYLAYQAGRLGTYLYQTPDRPAFSSM